MSNEDQLKKALRSIRQRNQNLHDPENHPTNAAEVIYRIDHVIGELEALSQILIVDLINRISLCYTADELKQLSFTLHIDYDTLPGTSERLKIRHMVQYVMRARKLEQLYAQLEKDRPAQKWTL